MEDTPIRNITVANTFIDRCKEKFGWGDLSSDVIIDVGCGEDGFCARAILDKFPKVGTIIASDRNPKVLHKFNSRNDTKIQCEMVDIEEMKSLQHLEGKMTKVISTNVFHLLVKKEDAFRNIYHLLKPRGEAAVLFCVKSGIYDWLIELIKNPRWKEAFKSKCVKNVFKIGFGADYYREMVERIGFQIIECSEERVPCPYPSDQACKDDLCNQWSPFFKIPSEVLEEFREECFKVLLKVGGRTDEGKPCSRYTFLSLLLIKPTDGACSTTKENSVS